MWPFAFTTAAMASACGPMRAMDFSGPAAKARPITSVSQPQTTSPTAPAMRSGRRKRSLIVIEVLNAGTPGFQLAIDVNETIDPSLQAGPAEAGFGVEIEREKFRRVLDVEGCGIWCDHGDHDLMVAGDLGKRNAPVEQAEHDLGKILVARRLHQLPLRRERADRLDARLGRQHFRRQGRHCEHDVAWFVVAGSVKALLDQPGVADLDEVFGAQRNVAFPAAGLARGRRGERHQAVELLAERIFVPGDGVEEGGIVLQHAAGIVVLWCALLAPDPFENAADRVLVNALDGIFDRVADTDDVDHRLDFGAGLRRRGQRAVDGAEAAPETEDMAEIVEMAFA